MGSLVAAVVEQPGSARVTRRLETLYQALAAVESSSQKATHVAALLRQCADDIHPVHVLPANAPATRAAVTPADRAAARDEAAAPVAGTKIAKAAPEGRKIRKTKGRQMDATKYATRHVALEILYIGWNYHGFALQESSKETVEEYLFRALRHQRLIPEDADRWLDLGYSRCGRTDKGVSAFGQVVSIKLRCAAKAGDALPGVERELDYLGMLNKALPADIRARGWCPLPDDTHPAFTARFSASYRHYKYFFHLEEGMDLEAMRDGAARLVGEHDFRNFCKMKAAVVHNFRREVHASAISAVPPSCGACPLLPLYVWDVRGSAFLYHQVRCMVSVLFMVARGQEKPALVSQLLDQSVFLHKPVYAMASEEPLVLYQCGFRDPIQFFRGSLYNQRKLYHHLSESHAAMALRSATLHSAMEDCLGFLREQEEGDGAAGTGAAEPMDEDGGEEAGAAQAAAAAGQAVGLKRRPGCEGHAGGGKKNKGFNADKRPGERPHLPMHRRPTESTYEERTRKLDDKKALKDTAAAEGVSGSSEV